MTMLGRRKYSRFLLAQPIDGNLRVREDVAIEERNDGELVILSSEPGNTDEQMTIEFPFGSRRRLSVRVRESRPVVVGDGPIRHRLRVSIEPHSADADQDGRRW